MSNIIIKFQNLQNNLKFTIPLDIYTNTTYNKNRRRIILLISDILEKNNKFKLQHRDIQNNIIINIELSCYLETINKADDLLIYQSWDNEKFKYLYQLFCNKITKNLDICSEVKSDYLINKILNHELDITKIANMSSDELCPDKSKNIKETLNLRNNQHLTVKTSTLYKCKNCGKKEVKIQEYQGRSLDEGSNLSLTCNFCNYNWVIG
jgi:DNA-directed RNA polymerase subunit M/transcription elongation factor TFIIS